MKRYQMSLRATVVLSLALLMGAAMLLVGVVMLKVSQGNLLRAKVQEGRLLRSCIEQLVAAAAPSSPRAVGGSRGASIQAGKLVPGRAWQMTVVDRAGLLLYTNEPPEGVASENLAALDRVMVLGEERISFIPSRSLLSWFLPERLVIEAPLLHKAKATGAVRLEASLDDVHQRLWRSQKIIFFFIAVDALVLVGFGTYIFSKLVVKPVQELVKTTESFREGDRLPDLAAGEQNELSKLSRALNRMLERLASNKEELRQHIVSLEQANLELKRAQKEVIMSEKLASVGRLAAGVAHEIGNPIGIVLGYLDLLQRADMEDSERRDLVERMGKEIRRIHEIIRELLDFTRSGSTERTTVSLHELIRETLSILDHQFRRQKIEVIQSLAAQPDRVFANADQLKQVLLNLLVNAVDAISSKGGGELRLSTRTTLPATAKEGESEPLRRRTDPPSTDYRHLRRSGGDHGTSWIEIQIADTGEGIAEENLDQVFDPFFTTKEPGKGTGLGLSVSAQIVEAMGGWLEISSSRGEGTMVTLVLPAEESRETTEDGRERTEDSRE